MSTDVCMPAYYGKLAHCRADMLGEFCHYLFKKTPIAFFDYGRFYDHGKVFAYSTCPDAEAKVYKFLPSRLELELFRLSSQRIVYMSHLLDVPDINVVDRDKYLINIDRYTEHNIYHRLYFVDRFEDYYRVSGFGVKSESKSAFNYYLNNLAMLEKFIEHFEFTANEQIITDVKEHLIALPDYLVMPDLDLATCIPGLNLQAKLAGNGFYEIPDADNIKIFTQRESECVALLAKGYSMKAAAQVLGISHRTVEMHLRNIKDKHGLYSKQQIVELWHSQS